MTGGMDCCDETVEIRRIHGLGAGGEHMGRRRGSVKWHFGIRFRRRRRLRRQLHSFASAGRVGETGLMHIQSNNSVHATVCVTLDSVRSVRFGSARVVFRGYVFAWATHNGDRLVGAEWEGGDGM